MDGCSWDVKYLEVDAVPIGIIQSCQSYRRTFQQTPANSIKLQQTPADSSKLHQPKVFSETLMPIQYTSIGHPPPPRFAFLCRPSPFSSRPKKSRNTLCAYVQPGGCVGRDRDPRDLHPGRVLRERVGAGHLRPQADRRQRVPLARAGRLPACQKPEFRQGVRARRLLFYVNVLVFCCHVFLGFAVHLIYPCNDCCIVSFVCLGLMPLCFLLAVSSPPFVAYCSTELDVSQCVFSSCVVFAGLQ